VPFSSLQRFVVALERRGELRRVQVEVDSVFEITEIASRLVRNGEPAVLFERVKGSTIPLAINVLASERRIELALGRHPQQVGEEFRRLIEATAPPSLQKLWQARAAAKRVLSMAPRRVSHRSHRVTTESPNLGRYPIMQCWPEDAGRFITCGLVFTCDPTTQQRNVGIYRLQVVGPDRLLMHWQIQKGGGFHYHRAEQLGQPLDVAIIIGADPTLVLAAAAPLPEGIDEIAFAGFLRGKPVPLIHGASVPLLVPADAEIILEGSVPPTERADEGPFGDHFGHYSHPAPFPVCHLKTITRRAAPIYLSTIVGKPPQEDKFLGNAVQEMMLPFIKLIHPEVRDLWAHYEAGFHSLVAVAVEERYAKEGMKTALGLLGTGQMSLTKCLVIVDADVNVRDVRAVLRAIRAHFDPAEDFLLLPGVPFDTLDFTSLTLNVGSKMVLDATRNGHAPSQVPPEMAASEVTALDQRIRQARLVEQVLLLVQVEREGHAVIATLVKHPRLQPMKLVAAVSMDVDLDDRESWMWGLFTRFDPARDVLFSQTELNGSWPVYRGVLGIDATFKAGYPTPIVMREDITRLVDHRWQEYWS